MGLVSYLRSDKEARKEKWEKYVARKKYDYRTSPSFWMKVRTEWFLMLNRNETIVIDGWLVRFCNRKLTNQGGRFGNWGDDVNIWLLEMMTGKKVIPAKKLFLPHKRKKYCVIGTVIPWCVTSKTTIWGSGYGLAEAKMNCKPKEVLAVRGPLTRQYLLSQDVECPAIYGDPALLLPKYYQPKQLHKSKIGIVLHHRDWDVMGVDALESLRKDALVIDLTRYECWTDIIDQICSCELILSSSLHGLIVSDAYGIPNLFMEFTWKHGNHFKYQDYFLSVKRQWMEPLQFDKNLDFDSLIIQAREQKDNTVIDTGMLEKACPFALRKGTRVS